MHGCRISKFIVHHLCQDKKKTTPVKGSDVKRTRRDRGELEDIMFKLFERQPNWALKQLVQETDQPAVCPVTYILNNFFTSVTLSRKRIGERLLLVSVFCMV